MERTKVVPRDEESIRLGRIDLCAPTEWTAAEPGKLKALACSGVRSGADMVLIVLAFGGWNQQMG